MALIVKVLPDGAIILISVPDTVFTSPVIWSPLSVELIDIDPLLKFSLPEALAGPFNVKVFPASKV